MSQLDLMDLLLQILCLDNANSESITVLWPLRSQDVTLHEYKKACQDTGSESSKARLLTGTLKGTGPFSSKTIKLFGWGKIGHMKKKYKVGKSKSGSQAKQKPDHEGNTLSSKNGQRRQMERHWPNQCHSKYRKDSSLLTLMETSNQAHPRAPWQTTWGFIKPFLSAMVRTTL